MRSSRRCAEVVNIPDFSNPKTNNTQAQVIACGLLVKYKGNHIQLLVYAWISLNCRCHWCQLSEGILR